MSWLPRHGPIRAQPPGHLSVCSFTDLRLRAQGAGGAFVGGIGILEIVRFDAFAEAALGQISGISQYSSMQIFVVQRGQIRADSDHV